MRILDTSDIHLRDKKPRCRLETEEEWYSFQEQVLQSIYGTALDEEVDAITIIGDIFHKPKSSQRLEQMFISNMTGSIPVYIMPGQHDLPGHSFENVKDSSFGVIWEHALASVDKSKDSFGILPMDALFQWEEFQFHEIKGSPRNSLDEDVLCVHRLITPQDKPLPNVISQTPLELLKEFPDLRMILAGDYHWGHEAELDDRWVFVAGCVMIQASDFKDYTPSVLIIDIGSYSIKYKRVPIYNRPEMITDDHIVDQEKRDKEIESAIEMIKTEEEMDISFEENVRSEIRHKDMPEQVRNEIEIMMGW